MYEKIRKINPKIVKKTKNSYFLYREDRRDNKNVERRRRR